MSYGTVSVHRGSGIQRVNPGAPAAQNICLSVPRGSGTQWATTGAPEAFGRTVKARRGLGTQRANRPPPLPCSATLLFAYAQGIRPVGHR